MVFVHDYHAGAESLAVRYLHGRRKAGEVIPDKSGVGHLLGCPPCRLAPGGPCVGLCDTVGVSPATHP